MGSGTVIFDFDRTLVRQETMAMFLRLVADRTADASACCVAGATASVAPAAKRMDVFRAEILRRTQAGWTVSPARDVAERLYPRLGWITRMVGKLSRHAYAGRKVLVATGSLSVNMPMLLAGKGVVPDGLVATEMGTPSCTSSEKARRVKDWLADIEGPVWGHGNLPHDQAMLALTDHPTAVPI